MTSAIHARLDQLAEVFEKYSCPFTAVSTEYIDGWDAATTHAAERIRQVMRQYPPVTIEAFAELSAKNHARLFTALHDLMGFFDRDDMHQWTVQEALRVKEIRALVGMGK